METVLYNKVDLNYGEVLMFDQKCLFTQEKIDRTILPTHGFIYNVRFSRSTDKRNKEITTNQCLDDAFLGCILTYKPIETIHGYRDIERWYPTGKHTNPSDVDKWIMDCCNEDDNSKEVKEFIDNFTGVAELKGIAYESLRSLFMDGYCFYFAEMLKSAFSRGETYICAPYGHVVWRDVDNRFYDLDGEFKGDYEVFLPTTLPCVNDFRRRNGLGPGATKEEIDDMIQSFKKEFPNV